METSAFSITTFWSSLASIQNTNSLHSKRGKGRITPSPDTSGLGVTGALIYGELVEFLL